VHRVEAKLFSVVNKQPAGLVLGDRPQRVARILLPGAKIV
jgi:hypothetical protein